MTQPELTSKVSLSTSTIGMYEQNRRQPDADIIIRLAKVL